MKIGFFYKASNKYLNFSEHSSCTYFRELSQDTLEKKAWLASRVMVEDWVCCRWRRKGKGIFNILSQI